MFLSASTTESLSGVEQRGLGAGRVMIYRCSVEERFGVVVALTVGWTRLVRLSLLKVGLRKTAATTEACAMVSTESLLDQ
jgi:hypothetical protein